MDFSQFQNWAFLGLISGGIFILWNMWQSVERLNLNVATIIEKLSWIEKITEEHGFKINNLEKRSKKYGSKKAN